MSRPRPLALSEKVAVLMVTAASPSQASAAPLPSQARKIIATLLVAAFVVILNETIMGVALPHLMADLWFREP